MIEAIILKLCLTLEQYEQMKQIPDFSSYAIHASLEEEEEENQCYFVRIEKW